MRRMLFRTIHDLALMLDRMCSGRDVVPAAGMIDSQRLRRRQVIVVQLFLGPLPTLSFHRIALVD
jgi:hypothetical protein